VAANIRRMRRELGLSHADLAARCVPPVAEATMSHTERGVRSVTIAAASSPRPGTLERLAAGLGVEPYVLLLPAGRQPCWLCRDSPPPGMICSAPGCGRRGPAAERLSPGGSIIVVRPPDDTELW
jgi:transcriptional regulator with XRE-family HTH domain